MILKNVGANFRRRREEVEKVEETEKEEHGEEKNVGGAVEVEEEV